MKNPLRRLNLGAELKNDVELWAQVPHIKIPAW
jgi:hypothetical protein